VKIAIEVKDRGEGDAIRLALGDPTTRAFVVVMGVLLPLTSGGRRRVLSFIADQLEEDKQEQINA